VSCLTRISKWPNCRVAWTNTMSVRYPEVCCQRIVEDQMMCGYSWMHLGMQVTGHNQPVDAHDVPQSLSGCCMLQGYLSPLINTTFIELSTTAYSKKLFLFSSYPKTQSLDLLQELSSLSEPTVQKKLLIRRFSLSSIWPLFGILFEL